MTDVIQPGDTTQAVLNLTLSNANTEYTVNLPAGCVHYSFQCRTQFDIRFAFVTGKVATPTAPYCTLKAGQTYTSPEKLGLAAGKVALFFASAQAGVVVEIVPWVGA